MGVQSPFRPEKLVVPFLVVDAETAVEVYRRLETAFGATDYRSPELPFDYTDYYAEEMGAPLYRRFCSFHRLVPPERLADIKSETNAIEQALAVDGRRRANLDPGLLCLDRFTLASTKDNGRRIPLRDGIYAEITLIYRHGDFQVLEWTYPDYRTRTYRDILCSIRELYRSGL